MKIKSWTGDEVDARVGMACIVGTDKFIQIITNITDSRIYFGRSWLPASLNNTVKMINCPFQVGDEIEICDIGERGTYWDKSIFSEIHQMMIDVGHEYKGKTYLELIRHTNPSLRTSEEYKNEKQ